MFGGRKTKRRQYCLLFTEDGRILELSLHVVKGYVVEHKTKEAWGLFPESCIPEEGTNRVLQVMTERDAASLSLDGSNHSRSMTEVISRIAEESLDETLADIQKKSLRTKLAEGAKFCIIAFASLICIIIIFGLISAGKLHLPDIGGMF